MKTNREALAEMATETLELALKSGELSREDTLGVVAELLRRLSPEEGDDIIMQALQALSPEECSKVIRRLAPVPT